VGIIIGVLVSAGEWTALAEVKCRQNLKLCLTSEETASLVSDHYNFKRKRIRNNFAISTSATTCKTLQNLAAKEYYSICGAEIFGNAYPREFFHSHHAAIHVVSPTRSLKYLYHQANHDSETLSFSSYQASISSAMHQLLAELYPLSIPDSTTEVKESTRGIQSAKTYEVERQP
jgi:hypothetical protein